MTVRYEGVRYEDVTAGLTRLGLADRDVAVHSSLRSFGHVEGGAETVARALLAVCDTILVPSFCSIGRTTAPVGDRPAQNAWDYAPGGADAAPSSAFDPTAFGPNSDVDAREVGQIAVALLRRVGALRSQHPSVSWAAHGPKASLYTSDHVPDDPNRPLKRLAERQGSVLLLGVGLTACTAVHLGEELAGRRPFIRWVRYADGRVRRVREYGCSDGFGKLQPFVEPMAVRGAIGPCAAVCYAAGPFVAAVAHTVQATPEITLCGRPECRCLASVLGGPIE